MSDTSQGPNWWLASDGKWYPPTPPAPAEAADAGPPPQAAGTITQPPPAPPYAPIAPPAAPAPYGYPGAPQNKQTNGLAIVSLVLGIIRVAGIGSLLAVIFGFMSRKKIRQSQGQESGDGMAIAGIVLGFVGIFGAIAFWVAIAALGTAVSSAASYADGFSYGTDHSGASALICSGVNVPSGDNATSWISGCQAAISDSSGNTGFGGNASNSGNTGVFGNS